MKHTPGPWEISCSNPLKIISNTEYGGIVAESSAWWYSTDQAIENARLIAAAPEMYEALIELLYRVNRNDMWVRGGNATEQRNRQHIVGKIRAILAKIDS